MKEAILATLASPSQLVRTQCASLVAAIATIEIPRGEWTELINNLCTNSNSDVSQIKLASLQTLGFICEELEPSNLSNELKNAVVVALTTSIDKDEASAPNSQGLPATKLAVKALLHSLPYATQNFKVENERNFIMQKVFDAIFVSDVNIRENAMQVLVELARQEYEALQSQF
jgi:importin subunit beta-1